MKKLFLLLICAVLDVGLTVTIAELHLRTINGGKA